MPRREHWSVSFSHKGQTSIYTIPPSPFVPYQGKKTQDPWRRARVLPTRQNEKKERDPTLKSQKRRSTAHLGEGRRTAVCFFFCICLPTRVSLSFCHWFIVSSFSPLLLLRSSFSPLSFLPPPSFTSSFSFFLSSSPFPPTHPPTHPPRDERPPPRGNPVVEEGVVQLHPTHPPPPPPTNERPHPPRQSRCRGRCYPAARIGG